MTNAYNVVCDYCGETAALTQPGRFCTSRHRAYFHRDALQRQRRELAAQAEAALESRDVVDLEHVARSAATLLAA